MTGVVAASVHMGVVCATVVELVAGVCVCVCVCGYGAVWVCAWMG